MSNLLIGVIIGVLLAVVVFSILTESCPPVREMGTAWARLSDDYQSGAILLDEYVRRADRLIRMQPKTSEKTKREITMLLSKTYQNPEVSPTQRARYSPALQGGINTEEA